MICLFRILLPLIPKNFGERHNKVSLEIKRQECFPIYFFVEINSKDDSDLDHHMYKKQQNLVWGISKPRGENNLKMPFAGLKTAFEPIPAKAIDKF